MGEASQKIFDHKSSNRRSSRAGEGVIKSSPPPTDTSSQIATLCHQSYITFSKGNNFMFGISSVVPLPVSVNHICQLIKLTS